MSLLNRIEDKVGEFNRRFSDIDPKRQSLLTDLAKYISEKVCLQKPVNLIFICTHNSRRSQMAQIWAQTAAYYYNIPGVACYSGGTEATAFNKIAVDAMSDCGFEISLLSGGENPLYDIRFSAEAEPVKCFSKLFDDPSNPARDFAAIMTCSDADENCPFIPGAERRFPVRYEDPKVFDGSDQEKQKYKERCEQIGIEMFFIFSSWKDQNWKSEPRKAVEKTD